MLGGGGIAEPASAVLGGGGTAEQDASAVFGGGGIAEQEDSAVAGGGGTAEQDDSAVLGGGGMTDPDNDVRGGGGIAEHASAVLGGGGIMAPERAGLSAFARTTCPASAIARPSSSPASDHAPDSMPSILQLIRPSGNPSRPAPDHDHGYFRPSTDRNYPRSWNPLARPDGFHDHVQKPVLCAPNCSRS